MKRRIIILGTIVLVAVLAWTAGWFYLANEVRRNVTALANADGVAAPRIACEQLGVGGYPFRLDVTCTGGSYLDGDLSATLSELRASVRVYSPFHVQLFARGPVDFADAFTGSRSRVDWQDLEASVRLSDWRIARASLVAEAPVWTDTLAGEVPLANASHAEFHLVDDPAKHDPAAQTAALDAYATVTGLVSAGFAIDQGQGTLEAEITGLPDDVRAFGEPEPLRRWQAAGGQLQIVSLKGNDADQSLDVSGLLALDPQGRANGSLNIASKGIAELVAPLVPEQLRGLVLGGPAEDGTYSQVLTIHSGAVLSGIIPVGMIPPLW